MSVNNKIVTAYSKSLFQNINSSILTEKSKEFFDISNIAESNQQTFLPNVYIVGEELYILSYTIKNSAKLENFIKNPTYREQQKLNILLSIFPGLTVTTKSFLKVLTDRSHLALIGEISQDYNTLLLKFKKSTKVKISIANSLEESYGNLLLSTLKQLTSATEIILDVSYNPKLLGGLIVEYNSVAIDASLLKEFSLFFTEV